MNCIEVRLIGAEHPTRPGDGFKLVRLPDPAYMVRLESTDGYIGSVYPGPGGLWAWRCSYSLGNGYMYSEFCFIGPADAARSMIEQYYNPGRPA